MSQKIRWKTRPKPFRCVQAWRPAIDAIFPAEKWHWIDYSRSQKAYRCLCQLFSFEDPHPPSNSRATASWGYWRWMGSSHHIKELHRLKGIPECVSSVDEVVEPKVERGFWMEKVWEWDAEIVVHIKHLVAVENGEIIDVDEEEQDQENKSDLSAGLTFKSKIAQMCEKVEAACWRSGCG